MTVVTSAVPVDGRDADDVGRCEEAGRTACSEKMMVDQLVAKMRLASFRTYGVLQVGLRRVSRLVGMSRSHRASDGLCGSAQVPSRRPPASRRTRTA